MMKSRFALLSVTLGLLLASMVGPARAGITDLTEWTLVEDPAHPGMSAVSSPASATLTATGSIPHATDIAYATVDGSDVASSSQGYYFSAASDFSISTSFELSALSSLGGGVFGFGIGEDIDGIDSAGVAGAVLNGTAVSYLATSRTNNVDSLPTSLGNLSVTTGTMLASYESLTGDILLTITPTVGTPMSHTFAGLQNAWDDQPLLASFFLRSDASSDLMGGSPLASGTLEATFSNFQVLSGTPIAVPEPSALALSLFALTAVSSRMRFRR